MPWIFQKLTFGNVDEDIQKLMRILGEASKQCRQELEKLRELEPDVSGEPPLSPIGDAIQAAAEAAGKEDLVHPNGTFSVHFCSSRHR